MGDSAIVKFKDGKSVQDFFKNTISDMVACAAGLLTIDKNDYILVAGRLIQAGIKSNMLKQLGKEIKDLTDKGKIKTKWFKSEYCRMSFLELLNFIDSEVPDEERLKAMKALFFVSAEISSSEQQMRLSYELCLICIKLNSGDILILNSAYKLYSDQSLAVKYNINKGDHGVSGWLSGMSRVVGHNIPSLIENHEDNLMKLKLITRRTYNDLSGFEPTPYYRMTELGYRLCDFVLKFDNLIS